MNQLVATRKNSPNDGSPRTKDIVTRKSSLYDGSLQDSNFITQCLTSRTPRSKFNTTLWFNSGNQKVPKQGNTCEFLMRSTHRSLRVDEPGPSGFNERTHKKQVLP